jgi:hypothetical protein
MSFSSVLTTLAEASLHRVRMDAVNGKVELILSVTSQNSGFPNC